MQVVCPGRVCARSAALCTVAAPPIGCFHLTILITRCEVDAPIPVKTSSGGEPPAVCVGQDVVALLAAFEPRDGDHWDAELSGDGG